MPTRLYDFVVEHCWSLFQLGPTFIQLASHQLNAAVGGYDTRCYFNVRSKADISQLNLPHGTDN